MTTPEEIGARNFVDHMLGFTIRIVELNESTILPQNNRSGFIYEHNGVLYTLTAGHNLTSDKKFIETNIVENNHVLCIEAGDLIPIYELNGWDFAYSVLPVDKIKKAFRELPSAPKLEITRYIGPIDVPDSSMPYGFAVYNSDNCMYAMTGFHLLERYECGEVNMEYLEEDEHYYHFALSGQHKGDKYYKDRLWGVKKNR